MNQYASAFIVIFDRVQTLYAIRYMRHVPRTNGASTKNNVLAIHFLWYFFTIANSVSTMFRMNVKSNILLVISTCSECFFLLKLINSYGYATVQ